MTDNDNSPLGEMAGKMHPEYGPCDGLRADGKCSECLGAMPLLSKLKRMQEALECIVGNLEYDITNGQFALEDTRKALEE